MEILDKIIWLLVGITVKWFIPKSFWDLKSVNILLNRRKFKKIKSNLQFKRKSLVIGNFQIDNVPLLQLFSPTLCSDDIVCNYNATEFKLYSDLAELEFSFLPKKIDQLKKQNKTVDMNDLYSLRKINFSRPQIGDIRKNTIELTFEPTNFKYYLTHNDSLDLPLLINSSGEKESIRERYKLDDIHFEWDSISSFPLHMWGATVTCVVTSDNYIVLPLRSKKQAISDLLEDSIERASMSCAEGMFRSKDSIKTKIGEEPSPFLTSIRSLKDELSLLEGTHFKKDELELMAIGFDSQRFQPLFVFLLKLSNISFEDLFELWKFAKDNQENHTLLPIEISYKSLSNLLKGNYPYTTENGKIKKIILFSNHQKFGMLVAAMNLLSAESMIKELKR